MNWFTQLFTEQSVAQSVVIYCLVIATGIAFGKIKIFGISFGITWVLFIGLLVSYFGLTINKETEHFVKEFGLILFVYSVGLQVGPGFFASLKKSALSNNSVAAAVVLLGVSITPVSYTHLDVYKRQHVAAFVFGGRRSTTIPLVCQSFNWSFGVYTAATMGSEMTAAAFGEIGKVRRDPFAMLPFMGYHMGDYVNHWLQFGRSLPNAPRIFSVNWFRKDKDGNFIWPGFGDNMRVLKWIVQRVNGQTSAVESPIGWMPRYEDMDWTGLEDFSREDFAKVMTIDREMWKEELSGHEQLFEKLYDKLPKEFYFMRDLLLSSLWRSPEHWELQPEHH